MKKVAVLGTIFAVIFLSFVVVSALNLNGIFDFIKKGTITGNAILDMNDCYDNQTILKINMDNNAHGELWNGTNYGKRVCYDELFGREYAGVNAGANVHLCNNNGVVKLSSMTNAHGEAYSQTNYDIEVCYGNLQCIATTDVCPSGNVSVLSLSSMTNAHLTINTSLYSVNICCFSPTVVVPPATGCSSGVCNVYWSNQADGLSPLTQSKVNDTVYLIAETGPEVTYVNFSIYEDDGILGKNNILVGSNVINSPTISGKASSSWKINDAAVVLSGYESDKISEFYFEAQYNANKNSSAILNANWSIGNVPNVPPVANIISPIENSIYFANEDIIFNHSSYDNDGTISSVSWNLSEGSLRTDNSFIASYSSGGNKQVTLTVTDNNGATDSDLVIISVISPGINVIPVISNPVESQLYNDYLISYAGGSSYAINATFAGSTWSITCFGGACPLQVRGFPITDPLGKRGVFNEMEFNWSFGDNLANASGMGLINGEITYLSPGDKILGLLLTAQRVSARNQVSFRIGGSSLAQCSQDGSKYFDGNVWLNTTGAGASVCNAVNSGVAGCCPEGWTCDAGGTNYCINQCNAFYKDPVTNATATISSCDHYNYVLGNKQNQCISDCKHARDNDKFSYLLRPENFDVISVNNYNCVWDSSANSCKFQINTTRSSGGPGGTTNTKEVWNVSDSGCVDGFNEQSWCRNVFTTTVVNGVVTTTGSCVDNFVTTQNCDAGTINLPFFNALNVMIAIMTIALGYIIYNKSKKDDGE